MAKRGLQDHSVNTVSGVPHTSRGASVERKSTAVPATEAQNGFGRIMAEAIGGTDVVITHHSVPRTVLVSVKRYNELLGRPSQQLDSLSEEFDALLARMQRSGVRRGTAAGFRASAEEMAAAAQVDVPRTRRATRRA